MENEMDFAEVVAQLESDVDRAMSRALSNGLSVEEAVKELRNIAQGWLDNQ